MRDTPAGLLQDLGRQLRRLRVESGLTQQELADLANVSRRTVTALENAEGALVDSLLSVLIALDATEWIAQLSSADDFNPLDVVARRTKPDRQRVRTR